MSILAKCPICKKLHPLKRKKCRKCGIDLDKAKRSGRVMYWIDFRTPDGKQRRESIDAMEGLSGYSLSDAQIALSKRRVQKRENRVIDMQRGSNLSFGELVDWYLDLNSVKKLSSCRRIQSALSNFTKAFGNSLVNAVKAVDLENYQGNREKQGASPATIDMELRISKTAVTKGFDNDKLDGRALKAFRATKSLLKFGQNARSRILLFPEYLELLHHAPAHLEGIIITAMSTGMRLGEILELKWAYVKDEFIKLPYKIPKERKAKTIPINHYLKQTLDNQPRALHHNFVFTYRGDSFSEGGIKRSFRTACINAKIPYGRKIDNGLTFHDIRRTVKTNMLKAGVNKIYRDLILGHSLKGMDAYYIKPDDESLKQAMQKYTIWFDEQIKNVKKIVDRGVDLAAYYQ